MIRLRLYSSAQPSRQLDQRMIGEDPVTIGRDAAADWVITDPDRALSRRHCTVRLVGNNVGVRDTSANGTFVNDGTERIPPATETIVAPGGSVRIGTFTLSVEALAATAAPPPEPIVTSAATPSLFAAPSGLNPVQTAQAPARPDPFASQLAPDPLLGDHKPGDRVALGDGDAWDRRPSARSGDWEASRDRIDHEKLIGTPRGWTEPARVEKDSGFGFDAPFDRPVLMAAPATPAAVAIPEDWAEPAIVLPPKAEPVTAPSVQPFAPAAPPSAPSAPPPVPVSEAVSTPAPAVPLAEPIPAIPRPDAETTPPLPGGTKAVVTPAPPLPATAAAPTPSAGLDANTDLFEAFCAGARLSSASFPADERAAVMVRLGEVYRGMVLGLSDLMGERTALKNEYRLSRTMVRPDQNNPFKWAPPQRLAIEVLRGDAGFAAGAEAVSESYRDIKMHILCMLAGMRAAIAVTMDALSPAAVEARLEGRNFLIKAQREAALWNEYAERFERFKLDAEDSADGPVNRAFRTAYEKQLAELTAVNTGYVGGPGGPR